MESPRRLLLFTNSNSDGTMQVCFSPQKLDLTWPIAANVTQ